MTAPETTTRIEPMTDAERDAVARGKAMFAVMAYRDRVGCRVSQAFAVVHGRPVPSFRVEYVVLCASGRQAREPIGETGYSDAIQTRDLLNHPESSHGPGCGPHRIVKRTITEEVVE